MAWPDFYTEAWRFQGLNQTTERVSDCALDRNDNLFLVGHTGNDTEGDFAVLKMNGSTGSAVWTWTGTYGDDTIGSLGGIVTDNEGDALACGATSTDETVDDQTQSVAMKFERDTGIKLWQHDIVAANATNFYGKATSYAIAVDHDDSVFVAGDVTGHLTEVTATSNYFADIFVIKLDGKTGSELWTVQHGNFEETRRVSHMRADSDGDLVVIGQTWDGNSSDTFSIFTVKVDGSDGSILWEYERETNTDDYGTGLDVDAAGDAYIVSKQDLNGVAHAGFVIKLDGSTGNTIWTYNTDNTTNTTFDGTAVDPTNGYITAVGNTQAKWTNGVELGSHDLAAVVLNSTTGAEIVRYQNGTPLYDKITCVQYGSDGSLYFGGYVYGLWTGDTYGTGDYMAVKFDPTDTSVGESEDSHITDTEEDGRNEDAPMERWQITLAAAGGVCLLLLSSLGVWRTKRKRDKNTNKAGPSVPPGSCVRSRTFLPVGSRGPPKVFLPVSARVGYAHSEVHPDGTPSG